jgi:hypothetical protein
MKKLLLLGCLTVIGLSFAPAPAHAWWPFNCCCSHHYSMKICVTPYNAFSPVCAGNFCCVGCNPFCCGPQQPPPPPWANGQACPPMCNSNCCESGCLPSTVPAPTNGNGGNGASNGTSSAPTVVPQAPVAQGYPAPMPYGLARPASNYPQGYYPNFNNTVANPYNAAPTMPVPNFNYQSNYNPYAYGMNPYANGMNPYANMNPYGGMNPYGR